MIAAETKAWIRVTDIQLVVPKLAGEPARHIRFDCLDIPLPEPEGCWSTSRHTGWKGGEPIRAEKISEPLSVRCSREVEEALDKLVVYTTLNDLANCI